MTRRTITTSLMRSVLSFTELKPEKTQYGVPSPEPAWQPLHFVCSKPPTKLAYVTFSTVTSSPPPFPGGSGVGPSSFPHAIKPSNNARIDAFHRRSEEHT